MRVEEDNNGNDDENNRPPPRLDVEVVETVLRGLSKAAEDVQVGQAKTA